MLPEKEAGCNSVCMGVQGDPRLVVVVSRWIDNKQICCKRQEWDDRELSRAMPGDISIVETKPQGANNDGVSRILKFNWRSTTQVSVFKAYIEIKMGKWKIAEMRREGDNQSLEWRNEWMGAWSILNFWIFEYVMSIIWNFQMLILDKLLASMKE